MIVHVAQLTNYNFADRTIKQRIRKYFGTEDQRDAYIKFIAKVWDVAEPDILIVDVPEIDRG